MKTRLFKNIFYFLPVLLLCLASCEDEETSSLGAVTNVTWEPTSGGAIISFTAPSDNSLLYVKAAYTNSLGEAVYNVVSVYDNQIEIEGLVDENKSYPVNVIAVDKNGLESPITTINVTPSRAYINLVKDNMTITSLLGGFEISWTNTNNKPVYVTVSYKKVADLGTSTKATEEGEEETRYLQSRSVDFMQRLRGLEPGWYSISYQVEDMMGNKSELITLPEPIEILQEIEIPKYTDNEDDSRTYIWELVPGLTTLKNSYVYDGWNWNACKGKNEYVFDGIINDNTKAETSENYTSVTWKSNNEYGWSSGNFPLDTDQMDIVIDMKKTYILSRIKAWTTCYWWGWQSYANIWDDRETGMSWDQASYNSNALKAFRLFGSLDGVNFTEIDEFEIAEPTYVTVSGDDYRSNGDSWYPKSSEWMPGSVSVPSDEDLQRAKDGFEWELATLSDPLRYIRIRYTKRFGNGDFLNGLSEITLFGGLKEDEGEVVEDEAEE